MHSHTTYQLLPLSITVAARNTSRPLVCPSWLWSLFDHGPGYVRNILHREFYTLQTRAKKKPEQQDNATPQNRPMATHNLISLRKKQWQRMKLINLVLFVAFISIVIDIRFRERQSPWLTLSLVLVSLCSFYFRVEE